MTISDIHYYIDQGLQRMGYFVNDHFEQEEIDVHINKVIRDFTKMLHAQKMFDKIHPLMKLKIVENLSLYEYSDDDIGRTAFPFMHVPFPVDFFLMNSVSARAHVSPCKATDKSPVKTIPVIVRDSSEESEIVVNPYSMTSNKKVAGFYASTGIKVYTNERSIIKGIFINYTCKPKTLAITSPNEKPDLVESVHDPIADLTIELLKKIIEKGDQSG